MSEFRIGDRIRIRPEARHHFEGGIDYNTGVVTTVDTFWVHVNWATPHCAGTRLFPLPYSWHEDNLSLINGDDVLQAEGVLVMPNPIELENLEMKL